MKRGLVALAIACFACDAQPSGGPSEVPGNGDNMHVPIDPGTPPPPPAALEARDAERLMIDQVAASFETVLGQPWIVTLDDGTALPVQRLSPLYGALGGADYYSRLAEAMDPHLLFAKLILQGAWIACDEAAALEPSLLRSDRRLVRKAELGDTTGPNILENVRDLKLRFHGERPDDAALEPYVELFEAASALPGSRPIDGWRAVCVALVTEPEFVLY